VANIDLAAIRSALATVLDAVSGVRAYARVPGQIVTSTDATAVVIMGGSPYVDYEANLLGACPEVNLELQIVVQAADLQAAQKRLDELLSTGTGSTRSLYDAIYNNQTLSGAVSHCSPPSEASQPTLTEDPWLVARMSVNVQV